MAVIVKGINERHGTQKLKPYHEDFSSLCSSKWQGNDGTHKA